ncbi:hypothetical protein [Ancylobacter amanitiformis]|uniref:Uncharacterized protein n=1 Tax=Ancylobacter amanitiformis TaxID=217069 RepID=A0ABU0LXN2_9HYPH|nr:hypothetical protein [Ancylobacter amanitiformis]MDQ0513358.1 hypothetical protein [Ancylobacter amanitiformis]
MPHSLRPRAATVLPPARIRAAGGLAGLVLLLSTLPGTAQIIPTTPAPAATIGQAMPFVGTTAPAGTAGRASPGGAAPNVGGSKLPQTALPGVPLGDPHTILPQPPPGKAAIGMSARFGQKDPLVPSGLVWRVFADQPEASGAYPLVAEATDPAPVFFLSPGGYVVHVSYGLASVARRIAVGGESRREQIIIPAGGVQLHADVLDKPIPSQKVSFDIFEGSFLQGRTSSRPFFRGANAGDLVVLPAGDYYVVSTYGDGNAVIQADLTVSPGKVTDATLHHRAAELSFRLASSAGGAPMQDVQWSVLSPGGDAVKESANAQPVFMLTEGQYTAVARQDGKTYSKDFSVEAGVNAPLEVLVGEQAAPPSVNTDEGSGD